ncbi:MAG: bifunctional polysaccharide deacetylase/glycosyltransferase family 2 protein [Acidimicrobiales bacterium]
MRQILADEPWIRRTARSATLWSTRLVIVAAVGVLALGTMIRHQADAIVGSPSPNGSPDVVFNDDLDATPVISTGHDMTQGIEVPPGTVVLTFDDGPDPRWTLPVLDVLDRHGVPATFFMVGEQVRTNPAIAREVVARGHEIGNHTHFHFEMGRLDERQLRLQLDLARLAIIDATGIETDLYRPPYSSRIDSLNPDEMASAQAALDMGWRVVTTDLSPADYDLSLSTEEILAQAIPPAGAGAMITLHDGGGPRGRTVELLDPLIERLDAAGYRFATVGEVVAEATGQSVVGSASPWDRFQASTLVAVLWLSSLVERVAVVAAIAYLSLYLLRMSALIVIAIRDRRRRHEPRHACYSGRVTVIVPAYNEAIGIAATLRSIEASDHDDLEVIVVDDGSTDATADVVRDLRLPRTRLIAKGNGGKASALNVGLGHATGEVVVMIDGDTVLEPSTIATIAAPFANPEVGAVSGNPKIGNPDRLLTRLQVSEYLLASSLERRLLAPAGLITTVPGAIGAWRRSAVREAGFVSTDTLAEDTDLTIAVGRGGWRVEYAPQARAWTEAPSTWRAFYNQRVRWTFGTLQALWKHRDAAFDRGSGAQIGRFAMPYMAVSGYLLAVLAPIIDIVLLANVAVGRWRLAALSWMIIATVGAVAGLVAARLDGDSRRDALRVPLQQLVYRPLMHLVTLVSVRKAMTGRRQTWGVQQRVGNLRAAGDAEPRPDAVETEVAA